MSMKVDHDAIFGLDGDDGTQCQSTTLGVVHGQSRRLRGCKHLPMLDWHKNDHHSLRHPLEVCQSFLQALRKGMEEEGACIEPTATHFFSLDFDQPYLCLLPIFVPVMVVEDFSIYESWCGLRESQSEFIHSLSLLHSPVDGQSGPHNQRWRCSSHRLDMASPYGA